MMFGPEDRRELQRWLLSAAVVLCAHASIAAAMVQWHEPDEEDDTEGAIVLIELAPVAAAPMELPNDAPPPEQVEEVPPEPVQEKVEEAIPEAPEPDVAMLPPPEPEPPKPQEEPPPPVVKEMPPVREAARPAAPAEGVPTSHSNAVPRWKTQVVKLLERNKRYPAEARQRRLQGVSQVTFTIDRHGHVVSANIVSSSGSMVLDNESLELLRRVEPFPTPPPELAGDDIKLTVPIRYTAK